MAKNLYLKWHNYRYFPYERTLAVREVNALLSPKSISEVSNGLNVCGDLALNKAKRLTYFSSVTSAKRTYATTQCRLEQGSLNGNGVAVRKQATRYSVHGLHEYKGKFNPQIVRFLLNTLGADRRTLVMDPFCGSGTTLVECEHLGIKSVGMDLNPLAVYTANARLLALSTSALTLRSKWREVEKCFESKTLPERVDREDESERYLEHWIPREALSEFNRLHTAIHQACDHLAPVFLTLVSNRIREYSLQEPADLRIRRRKSPMPSTRIFDVLRSDVQTLLAKLESAHGELPNATVRSKAILGDARMLEGSSAFSKFAKRSYDLFITSPPYATALPYIDTQRLSLIWLSLCTVSGLRDYEALLIGSREFRGKSNKNQAILELQANGANLPESIERFCRQMQKEVGPQDGFRRQAVPILLYRYFAGMRNVFSGLKTMSAKHAHFALVVGSNHTVLSGNRIAIDTPHHLAILGKHCGWQYVESIPLETYQRYGLHHRNAVNQEYLVILRSS